jgi:hypothetical protein
MKPLLLLLLLLAGCAVLESQWPRPNVAFTHQPDHAFARVQVRQWCDLPGHGWSHSLPTGSMEPCFHGGPNEYYLLEAYLGQPIRRGDVVVYARELWVTQYDAYTHTAARWTHPDCTARHVMHEVIEVSADGKSLLIAGTANRASDGWQRTDSVQWLVRGCVTVPEGIK